MTFVEVMVAGAFVTFFLIVHIYSRRLRAGVLPKGWDEVSVFCFAAAMGVIWPLTLLWLVASRESKREVEARKRKQAVLDAAKTETLAEVLGVGVVESFTTTTSP